MHVLVHCTLLLIQVSIHAHSRVHMPLHTYSYTKKYMHIHASSLKNENERDLTSVEEKQPTKQTNKQILMDMSFPSSWSSLLLSLLLCRHLTIRRLDVLCKFILSSHSIRFLSLNLNYNKNKAFLCSLSVSALSASLHAYNKMSVSPFFHNKKGK